MAKQNKKKIPTDKSAKESSELFHNIMKASMTVGIKKIKKKKSSE